MALKVKGGVIFDDSSGQDVVYEGAFPGGEASSIESADGDYTVATDNDEGVTINGAGNGVTATTTDSGNISLTADGDVYLTGAEGVSLDGPVQINGVAVPIGIEDLGTAGQVLTVNAGGDGLEWTTPA